MKSQTFLEHLSETEKIYHIVSLYVWPKEPLIIKFSE